MGHNNHINLVRSIVDKQIRKEYTIKQLGESRDYRYLGLTNIRVGPPNNLSKIARDKWELKVGSCLDNCIRTFLLPSQTDSIDREVKLLDEVVRGKARIVDNRRLDKQLELGRMRAKEKWRKRGYIKEVKIDSKVKIVGDFEESEIGKLKRGEVDKGFQVELVGGSSSDKHRDLYRILANSIYGKSKYSKLISRCIEKYLCMYEEQEKSNFRAHWGLLCNGSYKWISSWFMMRSLINNRDLCFSNYELDIVSRLYDLNIRVYAEAYDQCFRCIWRTERKSDRVVILCISSDNTWCNWLGRYDTEQGICQVDKRQGPTSQESNVIDSTDMDNRIKGTGVVEILCQTSDSLNNRKMNIEDLLGNNLDTIVGSENNIGKHNSIKCSNDIYPTIHQENYERYSSITDSSDIDNRFITLQDCKLGLDDLYSPISCSNENGFSSITSNSSVYNNDDVINSNINDSSGKQELDLIGSIISTNTETEVELRNIEQQVNSLVSKNVEVRKLNYSGRDVVKTSLDSLNIGNTYQTAENDSLLCSQITIDTEDSRELKDIEKKVNSYIDEKIVDLEKSCSTINTEDSVDNCERKEEEDSESHLGLIISRKEEQYNKIDIEVEESRVSKDHIVDSSIEEVIRHNSSISSIEFNNINRLEEGSRQSRISNTTHLSRRISRRLEEDVDKIDTQRKLEKSSDSKGSWSSIDEDLKWLFEDKDKVELGREHSSYYSVDSNNTTDIDNSSNEGVVETRASNKGTQSRRRKFWFKWKNKIRNIDRNRSKKEDKSLYQLGLQQKNIEAVFDYSSRGLDKEEIELLSKGSTFCIANDKIDEDRFKADIYAYSRRLRLHEEYREQGTDTDYSQIFSQILRNQNSSQSSWSNSQRDREVRKKKINRRLPSTYDPESQNRNLARYCSCIQEETTLAIKTKVKFKDNISIEHRKALNSLKKKIEDKDIVVTLADKGSGIVVVDYEKYIEKGTYYIETEAKAYTITTKPHKQIIEDIVRERNKIVKKLRETEVIEVGTATYCMKQLEEKVTGMKFYYKVHKDKNIASMPLRPLQSCIGAPTQHLSQVLTDILQPFLTQYYIPTFIQDSNQLLYRLKELGTLDRHSTLISSDVSALYPSIPHKEGLESVQMFLEQHSGFVMGQIRYIMEALKLVITQNYVMWNGKIYKQESGVAMGTPVAVAYANIFMHWIDTQLRHRADYIVEHIRYIDDNLFIIPEDKIEETMTIANSLLVPHIKFTYEKLDKDSIIGLPFLDTQLFISDTLTIESRLYTKKTDKHTYLLPTSFHPSHITKNIPQAVFNRIRRICSNLDWFKADAMMAMTWLEDRGYKILDIKRAVDNSVKKDRWEMIETIEKNRGRTDIVDENKTITDIPLIVTYNHNARLVKQVLMNRQPLLNASFDRTRVKPRLAYRRQRNISDMLIQKGLRGPIVGNIETVHTLAPCGNRPKYRVPCPCKGQHDQQLCRCCVHLKLNLEGIKARLHKVVNCDSKNLIYVIGCKSCNKLYIGETQQQLKERFLQHLNNIQKFSQPLYTHFNSVHKPENIFISVLETVRSNDHAFRKIREAWWINKLQTLEPRGFNIKLECNQIYQQSSVTINVERDKRRKWR